MSSKLGNDMLKQSSNRYGDWQLNRALDVIARNRSHTDPGTGAYIERRTKEGRTPREVRRRLKHLIAARSSANFRHS